MSRYSYPLRIGFQMALKYKNIGEEFEEENTMVLPMKQFGSSKKDKSSKKSKKPEKLPKPEKPPKPDKHDKKWGKSDKKAAEKIEKKLEKVEKKLEKKEKRSETTDKEFEAAGIANMSFEDDPRTRLKKEVVSTDDSEGGGDLRMAPHHKFGSLKRGINPFSKLGGRI